MSNTMARALTPVAQKLCSKCLTSLPFTDFAARPTHSTGVRSACRRCEAEAYKAWRAGRLDIDRERVRENMRERRATGWVAAYEASNPHLRQVRDEWRQANRIKVNERANARNAALTDAIVRGRLAKLLSVPGARVPAALIEVKREQICLHRLVNEMRQVINQREEEHHES